MIRWQDEVTCRSQLHNETESVKPSVEMRDLAKDALPSRTDECRLGVVVAVPSTDAELEPAFGVDWHLNRPKPPGVIMLDEVEDTVKKTV